MKLLQFATNPYVKNLVAATFLGASASVYGSHGLLSIIHELPTSYDAVYLYVSRDVVGQVAGLCGGMALAKHNASGHRGLLIGGAVQSIAISLISAPVSLRSAFYIRKGRNIRILVIPTN